MIVDPLEIPVGRDDAGQSTALVGTRHRFADRRGPRILVTGCVHGDEITSTGAIWYLRERLADSALAGAVTLIPCVNQLAARASQRQVPIEGADLNRRFPGRAGGALSERLAAALVALLDEHDALIDVHTAGWSSPFVLLDHVPDADLHRRIWHWAGSSGLPVIDEMPAGQSDLKGLDRSWSAWAVRLGKPAVTMELSGFHRLESPAARRGAEALGAMLAGAVVLAEPARPVAGRTCRRELHADCGGLFEALAEPGDHAAAGQLLGRVRALSGEIRQDIAAPQAGLILALQPISAVHVGSWLATLAVAE